MQLTPELADKMETCYLRILIELLDKNQVEVANAKNITKEYLNLSPTSFEDMKTKYSAFTSKYPEFNQLLVFLSGYENEDKTKHIISKMQTLIRSNKVDEALNIVNNSK